MVWLIEWLADWLIVFRQCRFFVLDEADGLLKQNYEGFISRVWLIDLFIYWLCSGSAGSLCWMRRTACWSRTTRDSSAGSDWLIFLLIDCVQAVPVLCVGRGGQPAEAGLRGIHQQGLIDWLIDWLIDCGSGSAGSLCWTRRTACWSRATRDLSAGSDWLIGCVQAVPVLCVGRGGRPAETGLRGIYQQGLIDWLIDCVQAVPVLCIGRGGRSAEAGLRGIYQQGPRTDT